MDDQTQNKSMMEKLAIPLSIVLAGAIMGGALYYSNLKVKTQEAVINTVQKAATGSSIKMRPIGKDDHILGNPDAPVKIVEYSDTECPFCKQFHSTLRQVMADYGSQGKVAWVYRHFPIDQLHSRARKEAEATECANELGGADKFWAYINMLYDTTTSNNTLDPSELPKIAVKVGLDVKAFNTCLSSGKYAAKVETDYQDAINAGGKGTPNSIIISKDGTKTVVEGAQSYGSLKSIIDAVLAG